MIGIVIGDTAIETDPDHASIDRVENTMKDQDLGRETGAEHEMDIANEQVMARNVQDPEVGLAIDVADTGRGRDLRIAGAVSAIDHSHYLDLTV